MLKAKFAATRTMIQSFRIAILFCVRRDAYNVCPPVKYTLGWCTFAILFPHKLILTVLAKIGHETVDLWTQKAWRDITCSSMRFQR